MLCLLSSITVATLFFSVPSQAIQCEARAITLPLKYQKLGDGDQTYMRGVSLRMGSPEQPLSFTLSAARRNTYAYGAEGLCGNNKPYSCFVGHGGQYNQSLSTTAQNSLPPIAPFIDEKVDTNWTSDSVTLGNGATIHEWRFGTPRDQLHDDNSNGQAEIGVAVNSTLINALHTAGNISSNAYSLFWGDEFTDEPRDGSFTLGGYDESIMGDSMITKGFTRSEERCAEGMIVEVTNMKLNHQDGPTVDLLDGLGTLNVCVIPSLRAVMAVPRAYGEKLITSMGAIRSDNGTNMAGSTSTSGPRLLPYTPILEPDSATFKGNLSVTLQDNVTVTFTDEQLLVRKGDPYLDSQGVMQYNASRVGLTVLSMRETASKDLMARLGGMFFSSAYMMVNHDKSEFTIASVRKDATEETLVGVDTANNCVAYLNGTAPGQTVQSSSPRDPQDSENPQDSGNPASPLSTGAIVGIAVGAAAVVVFLAIVAFRLWRRRRRGNGLVAQHTALAEAPEIRPYIFEKKGTEVHEAPNQGAVLKMSDDEREYAVEMDGNAQPSELPGYTQMGPR